MDPATQVTYLHGHSVLDLALEPLEANFALPLVHEIANANDRAMLDIAIASEMNLVGDPAIAAADAARDAGNSPNTVMAAAAALIGPRRVERTLGCTKALIDLFASSGLADPREEGFPLSSHPDRRGNARAVSRDRSRRQRPAARSHARRRGARGGRSVFLEFLAGLGARVSRDAVLAAIATTIAWCPLMRKRISRLTAETLPWYLRLYGVMIGASIPGAHHQHGSLCGIPREERFGQWTMADFLCLALIGRKPTEREARPLQILTGLLISNGPGSITAMGAKGAVSADGPQTPARVHINKAMLGCLSHCGFSHGGNGYEGMAFLLERFEGTGLEDPTDPDHGIDLAAMATSFAESYRAQKIQSRETGTAEQRALPGVHHPVFRGKPVNYDPRERFIARYLEEHGDYNIFHAFYRELVQALYDTGASPYVFCVNVDAVIAALLLALVWRELPHRHPHGEGPRDRGFQRVPLRPHDRRRGRDRRPSQPRPQHGHAHAAGTLPLRRLSRTGRQTGSSVPKRIGHAIGTYLCRWRAPAHDPSKDASGTAPEFARVWQHPGDHRHRPR